MRRLAVALPLLLALAGGAIAQPGPAPGPGPVPSPWQVNGAQVFLPGQQCVVMPQAVAGGCKGNNTINAAAIYVANSPVLTVATGAVINVGTSVINGGVSGRVLYDNAGIVGEYTQAQLTAQINLATASLSGALPAWPNNATTFLRGDGTYAQVGNAALVNSSITIGSTSVSLGGTAATVSGLTLASPTLSGTVVGDNTVPLSILKQSGANSMLGNWTGGTANVLANAMPSCADSGGNHLNYVAGTGVTCGTGTGNAITALTGDVAATGPGSVTATLATVNANVGSFGSSTAIPNFTVNAKGLVTAAGTNAVVAPAGTLTGTTLAANVVTSSLASVGTLTGGGTGAGFTIAITTSTVSTVSQGDLLYASGSNTIAALAKNASATRYLSNTGTTNNPAWAQVDLTNGVTGLLPLSSGGSNANLTASAGGIVYSTASAFAILAGTVTANQCLLSGSNAPPTWGSCAGGAAVASVTANDATLTISPTTGSVLAQLNLANANVWTAQVNWNVARTIASGASATLDDFQTQAATTTVTGGTNITTAAGFNKVSLYRPTITDSSSITITTAATLYIANSPLAAGSVTITNSYALNVAAGTANFGGNVNVGVSSLVAGGNAMTFPSAAANVAALNLTGQVLSGGATVTAFSIGTVSTGTTTIDAGNGPQQWMVNTGASTIAAPTAASGSVTVIVTNNTAAGAITLSGFAATIGTFATGDTASATCTITNASPGVVTYTAHGLINNQQVFLTTTGGLPTGLSVNTIYYVRNKATNTFELSATTGGASINTSSAGSGTHTCHVASVYALAIEMTNGLATASWYKKQ